MFGSCALMNYFLIIMISLSNIATVFIIYPFAFDFIKSENEATSIAFYLGVIF